MSTGPARGMPILNTSAYAVSDGISQNLAQAADQEIKAIKDTSSQPTLPEPVQFFDHQENTRLASNTFLMEGPKEELARLLRTTPENVRQRYIGSEPGTCVELDAEYPQKSLRTDYVFTILALNDMSYSNGLPALGREKKTHELRRGQALHFIGDQLQTWSGKGGGNLIWFYWKNLELRK